MIAVIQGMQFPIEPNPEVEPIRIVAVVGGTESLLPLTLLSLFRVTITQGRLSEMVLCLRRKIELAHIGE